MRVRDEHKEEAIINASIKLINEIGFVALSMSKIAKSANVAAATIYIYFENKDDLLRKCYLYIKKKMSTSMFEGVDFDAPVKDTLTDLIKRFIAFCLNNKQYFLFVEQFANAPVLNDVCKNEGREYFKPFHELIVKGQKDKIFKQYDEGILLAFTFAPLFHILKYYFKEGVQVNQKLIDIVNQMIWDALKI
jgi:AcrR family transcriptional regulator